MSERKPDESTPPSPPLVDRLRLVDETIARRPLALAAQLRLGARVASASAAGFGWRLIRSLFGAPLWIFLVAFAAVVRAALHAPDAARVDLVRRVGGIEFEIPRAVLTSPLPVFGGLAVLVTYAAGRAVFDALMYGGLREAATGRIMAWRTRVRRSAVAYGLLALLELGLVTAGVMFSWPIVRTVARLLHDPDVSLHARLFIQVGIVLTLGLVAWMRFLVMIQASWTAWRAQFFAATLVTATLAPLREPLAYSRLFTVWALVQFVNVSVVAAALVARFGAGEAMGWGDAVRHGAPWLATGFLIAVVADALLDATLVGMVGWRLGDVSREFLMSTDAEPRPGRRDHDASAFEPPVRGVFHVPHGSAAEVQPSIVSFAQVASPAEEGEAGWVIEDDAGHAVEGALARGAAKTAWGAEERIVGAETPDVEASPPSSPHAVNDPFGARDAERPPPASGRPEDGAPMPSAEPSPFRRAGYVTEEASSMDLALPDWLAELVDEPDGPAEGEGPAESPARSEPPHSA